MEQVLISIIIPVYNAEKYLDECLESVTGQTYKSLEIILLPGKSSDNSTEICKKWAEKDPRIKITDQDRNCIGYARNKGVAAATGEYFGFCDADDKLLPNYVEEMVNSAVSNDSDMVECEYYNASEDLSQKTPYETLHLLEDYPHEFYERFGSVSVWRYIVRKSFWEKYGFRYPATVSEDMAVYSLVFAHTSKVSFVYKLLYLYRENPRSITHNVESAKASVDNFISVSEYMVGEHKRLGVFDRTKETIMSQLEYHANIIMRDCCSELALDDRIAYEKRISDALKSLFECNMTIFDVKAFGWGSRGTGVLCDLMTKSCKFDGKYISNVSLVNLAAGNTAAELEGILSEYKPTAVVIDLMEETNEILAHQDDLGEYLKQWGLGSHFFSEAVKKSCPQAKVFVVEKYLATRCLIDGEMREFPNIEEINIKNELLGVMYKNILTLIPGCIFIAAIPEKSRYSFSDDPKGGHNYDETYYHQKIIDIIHFGA